MSYCCPEDAPCEGFFVSEVENVGYLLVVHFLLTFLLHERSHSPHVGYSLLGHLARKHILEMKKSRVM